MERIQYRRSVLFIPTRNLAPSHRHFMKDLMSILPNAKKVQPKKYKILKCEKQTIEQIPLKIHALCQQIHSFILFETKGTELLIHCGVTPRGPTITFNILNIHMMKDLMLAGNFSTKCKPAFAFDQGFKIPKYNIVKEVLINVFDVQQRYPDGLDRLIMFASESEQSNRIWFRQYEIVDQIIEIGPRFAMELLKIQDGLFSGTILYQGSLIESIQEDKKIKKLKKGQKKMEQIIQQLNEDEEYEL